jgi:hypothetical protein
LIALQDAHTAFCQRFQTTTLLRSSTRRWEGFGRRWRAYPELYAIIGGVVPDYRGIFLRGYGSRISTHYGTVTHSSGALNALQGDSIRNITGSFLADVVADTFYGQGIGAFRDDGEAGWGDDYTKPGELRQYSFDASRVVPTAIENRPINISVRYMMRALP